jgi:hypothetical protein
MGAASIETANVELNPPFLVISPNNALGILALRCLREALHFAHDSVRSRRGRCWFGAFGCTSGVTSTRAGWWREGWERPFV